MGVLARLVVLFPLALSIVGIVLSSLCLFAGHTEDFLEDYDIIRLNTSKIGQDVIPWDELDLGNIVDNLKRDVGDDIRDKWDDLKDGAGDKLDELQDDAKDKANDLTNDVIEQVADRLGISDWYSIHVMSACHGSWEPNATDPSPSLNITNCQDTTPNNPLNLTEMLDKELAVGDLGINLADINWPPEIQEKIDLINDLLLAIFIVYVVGMGFCGLAVLGCIGSLILASSRLLVLFNFVLSGLGALALTIGSIVVTIVGTKGISELNKVAKEVSVHASRGKNFLIISWVAAACMIAAAIFWTTRFCVLCVQKRRDKKMAGRKGSY